MVVVVVVDVVGVGVGVVAAAVMAAVVAGNVAPSKGLHHVFFRRATGLGGDGKRVEHTVLFAMTGGVNVGFSAAVDGSLAKPDPAKQTAAIRATRADTAVMWQFATVGSAIDVMP